MVELILEDALPLGQAMMLPPHLAKSVVTGVVCDSRAVRPGNIFVAIAGEKSNGLDFVQQACAAGAVAIVAPLDCDLKLLPDDVACVLSPWPRRDYAFLASKFYQRQPESVVAVTGTNGKTSVVDFCRQIWSGLGHRSASLGTLGVCCSDDLVSSLSCNQMTTPDALLLHKNLQEMADQNITHLAIEASSHALHQDRLNYVQLKAAAFTNIGRDHMDYHQTHNDYLAAKMRLFWHILPVDYPSVFNIDDPVLYDIVMRNQESGGMTPVTLGRHAQADCRLLKMAPTATGTEVTISFVNKEYCFYVPLIGDFQIYNLLTAALLVLLADSTLSFEGLLPVFSKIKTVPGRLQHVADYMGADIYVDYAHTPDALSVVLQVLRAYVQKDGCLWVVFGCGGDRDTGKRSVMGDVAAQYADKIVITDDNPRTEDPCIIRAQIINAHKDFIEIAGRHKAIDYVINHLSAGDIVLIAGKGHEEQQIIGDKVIHYSDTEQVRASIVNLDRM